MALTDGLVSYYKFDGNANDSVGSNNGIVHSATVTSSGKINQAYDYNYNSGTQYISYSSTELNQNTFNNDYSVSLWVKPNAFPSSDWYTIINKSYTSHTSPYYQFLLKAQSNGFQFLFTDSSNNSAQTIDYNTSTIKWYHLIFTYNSTAKQFNIYVDGINRGNLIVGNHTNYNTYITTGILSNLTTNSKYQMKGSIDEMGFWNRELSASEVSTLYNSGAGLSYPFGVTTSVSNNNFFTLSLGAEF